MGEAKVAKFLTREGLEKKIEAIRKLERELLEVEKQLGDSCAQSSETWHDNAPYETLRDLARQTNQRLNGAHRDIRNIEIVEYPREVNGQVKYGTGVVFERDGNVLDYKIVGHGDSDIDEERVLYEAPIAQALMSRREGESFNATVNSRVSHIKIIRVYPLV